MTLARKDHFGGRSHSYYADDAKLPGVTTILQQVPKPKLLDWASRMSANYAIDHWDELAELPLSERHKLIYGARQADLQQAATRGTKVHALAEHLAAGRPVDVPELLIGHVESYQRFLDEFEPDPVALELVVCNRTAGYCGTSDLVAQMLGQIWLLELKTARSGIFPESALQACAYSRAETYCIAGDDGTERPLAELGIERCAAIHIRGDGYELVPLETGEGTWAYFQHLAWMHHHKDEAPDWLGAVIEPPLLVPAR